MEDVYAMIARWWAADLADTLAEGELDGMARWLDRWRERLETAIEWRDGRLVSRALEGLEAMVTMLRDVERSLRLQLARATSLEEEARAAVARGRTWRWTAVEDQQPLWPNVGPPMVPERPVGGEVIVDDKPPGRWQG